MGSHQPLSQASQPKPLLQCALSHWSLLHVWERLWAVPGGQDQGKDWNLTHSCEKSSFTVTMMNLTTTQTTRRTSKSTHRKSTLLPPSIILRAPHQRMRSSWQATQATDSALVDFHRLRARRLKVKPSKRKWKKRVRSQTWESSHSSYPGYSSIWARCSSTFRRIHIVHLLNPPHYSDTNVLHISNLLNPPHYHVKLLLNSPLSWYTYFKCFKPVKPSPISWYKCFKLVEPAKPPPHSWDKYLLICQFVKKLLNPLHYHHTNTM